ncbi:MAG: hypothetical protein JWQ89_3949 [Devosia sp.]|uniref:hypothetical protein n=1 Tax=Devosia sp. TaxID=1871048 RepID=UPI00261613B5|nr:hypothetical protein [Devosia sp.]MDB5542222.1 hypothetical protein [Devosia sp.]
MDVLVSILFWIHLVALGLGGAAAFGLPVVGSKMAAANAETRPLLFSIAHGLSTLGRSGVGLLIITGPLMVWLKYNGVDGFSAWFWVKMVLVVLLLAIVIYAGINTNRAEKGDREAGMRSPRLGLAALVVFVLVIGSAVMTFG